MHTTLAKRPQFEPEAPHLRGPIGLSLVDGALYHMICSHDREVVIHCYHPRSYACGAVLCVSIICFEQIPRRIFLHRVVLLCQGL